eukprot:171428_1
MGTCIFLLLYLHSCCSDLVWLQTRSCLEELILLVNSNGAVSLGVGNASEDEALIHLIIIKEGLLGLINLSLDHLSGAGGAGSGTATVRKLNSGLLGGINDEDVIGALDGLVNSFFLGDELDGESEGGGAGDRTGGGGETLGDRGGGEDEEGVSVHGDWWLV